MPEDDLPQGLHPQMREALLRIRAHGPAPTEPAAARAAYRVTAAELSPPPAALARVEDRSIPGPDGGIPLRVYTPLAGKTLPGILYLHGGWFIRGDLETHDRMARQIAAEAEAVVVAVEYRLAPEHPHPAATEDADAALLWLARHAAELGVDADRLAIAGDSAGGNLATVTAARAAARSATNGPALRFQALIYPVTDSAMDTPSWHDFAAGPVIPADTSRDAWSQYVPDAERRSLPDISPLRLPPEHLAGLPPALVITAEFDPLRDEAERYVEALRDAGVTVQHTRYAGIAHGFAQMGGVVEAGQAALGEVAAALKQAL